jgi:hypothetical protein
MTPSATFTMHGVHYPALNIQIILVLILGGLTYGYIFSVILNTLCTEAHSTGNKRLIRSWRYYWSPHSWLHA